MEIKDIIKNRRIELGLTMLDVAKKSNVSEATVSRWESGDIANMKRDKIVLLANALKLSPNIIMGWNIDELNKNFISEEFKISNEEQTVIQNYRTLNNLGKQKANEYISDLAEQEKYTASKPVYIYGEAAALGGERKQVELTPEEHLKAYKAHKEIKKNK